jgi:hypothetical protein
MKKIPLTQGEVSFVDDADFVVKKKTIELYGEFFGGC